MQTELWQRLESLFHEVVDLPVEQQAERLWELCEGNRALYDRVLILLEKEQEESPLTSAVALAGREAAQDRLQPGEQVGRFEIVRRIDSGGMGDVYEALQQEPVRRTVALKLMRQLGPDPSILARFEAERQTLAMMDHPAIATVLDAGSTPDGRPFFVMELIHGTRIDQYFTTHTPDVDEALRLFISICRGVQHAHQRGVIHRDLKPSNILITDRDGGAAPVIIDFGIAKATTRPFDSALTLTHAGQLVGTPRYMSPEQVDSIGMDVDTRSDVYALGTIFYELLTGDHPLSIEALSAPSVETRQREYREAEPPLPSRRARESGASATRVAALKGDLDWILLKCLSKARDDRYESAGELADDLERSLRNVPVEAGPLTLDYRWRKFYRRNRAAVLATGVVTLSLLGGLALAGAGLQRALVAETEALEKAAAAEEVSAFLVGLFKSTDPNAVDLAGSSARELLDHGARQLDTQLDTQPLTKAHLLLTLGDVYENLGLLEESFAKRTAAVELYQTLADVDPAELSGALTNLSIAARRLGDFDAAITHANASLNELQRELNPDLRRLGEAWSAYGVAKIMLGAYEDAETALIRAKDYARQAEPNTVGYATALYNLAGLYHYVGRYRDAVPYVEQALKIHESVEPRAPRVSDMHDGLGILNLYLGEYDASEAALKQGLRIRESRYGPGHYLVAESLQNLAQLYLTTGNPLSALDYSQRAIAISDAAGKDAEGHNVVQQFEVLAVASARLGDMETARSALERVRTLRQQYSPPGHPDALQPTFVEGILLQESGEFDEAATRFQQVLDYQKPLLDPGHPYLQDVYEGLVRALSQGSQPERAAAICRQALAEAEAADRLQLAPAQRTAILCREM